MGVTGAHRALAKAGLYPEPDPMIRDDSSFTARQKPQAFAARGVLYGLLAVCMLIELCLQLSDLGVFGPPRLRALLYEYGGFWPGLLGPWAPNYPGQPYAMFFTYAFLHAGLMHLAFNMFTLVSLGRLVLARVGVLGFCFVMSAAVLGGALGYGLLTNAPNPMVGASGGLFGLAGALLSWNYVDRFTASQRLMPVGQAVLGLLLLNLVLWWLMDGHLAWETHLGGFLFGWVAALLIDPRPVPVLDKMDTEAPHETP